MNNYKHFYGLLRHLPVHTEEMKEQFVLKYTDGRAKSLKDMRPWEYDRMCKALEASLGQQSELRHHRSIALKLMQQLGIDTTDWVRINAFCRDSRIMGSEFGVLIVEDLKVLAKKLRGIQRKGGLQAIVPQSKPKPKPAPAPKPTHTNSQQILIMPLDGGAIC